MTCFKTKAIIKKYIGCISEISFIEFFDFFMLPSRRKKEKDDILNKEEMTEPNFKEVEDNLFCPIKKHKIVLSKIRSFYGVSFIFFFLIIAAFVLRPIMGSSCDDAFSVSDITASASVKSCSSDLFANPAKNFLRESLEICLIQENSLVAVSVPDIVIPKTLGSINSEDIDYTDRKGIIEYEVGPDDTLASVAEKFNISIETILWANDLSSKSVLKTGQTLVILPVSGVMYFVEEGDTMENIASEYKGEVRNIIAFNELKGEGDIYVGDVLIIPDGKIVPKAPKPQFKQVPLADAYFLIPVEGRISQGLHFYNAIDIANSCGKPVVAAAGGKVQRSGWISSVGGNVVTILHPNGVVTYYGHLSAMSVAPGQTVAAGQIIGYVGRTGLATGCHLHFDVRGAKNFMSRYPVGSTVSWK